MEHQGTQEKGVLDLIDDDDFVECEGIREMGEKEDKKST